MALSRACHARAVSALPFLLYSFGLAANEVSPAPLPVAALVAQIVQPYIDHHQVMGLSIGIAEGGGSDVHFEYGEVQQGTGVAPDAQTMYEIGSITKTFTGTLLALYNLEDRLRLDDTLAQHLPRDLTIPQFEGQPILLRHLVTHTSGLPRMPANFAPGNPKNPYVDYTRDKLYEFVSTYPLPRAPGALFEYSNVGAALAGQVLALEAGVTYEQLVVRRICDPLHMGDTKVLLSANQRQRLAKGYRAAASETGLTLKEAENWTLPAFAGAGALRSTLSDMMRYLHGAMGDGPLRLRQAFTLAETPIADVNEQTRVGYFWHITRNAENGKQLVWHNGETGGYHSFLGFFPEERSGIVILSNTATEKIDAIAMKILDGLGK